MSFPLAIPLLLAAMPGFADLAAIDREVAVFTGAAIGTPGGAIAPLDRRLRLVPCPGPLVLGWHTARRDSVTVQCPAGSRWRLFVPVSGAGQSGIAAAPAITRGDSVTIAVTGEGFSVSQPGEAMESGPVGAWIKVRAASAAQSPRDWPCLANPPPALF